MICGLNPTWRKVVFLSTATYQNVVRRTQNVAQPSYDEEFPTEKSVNEILVSLIYPTRHI